jgi:hypothetical protein
MTMPNELRRIWCAACVINMHRDIVSNEKLGKKMSGMSCLGNWDCIDGRRELEDWALVPIGSPWDRMKLLGSQQDQ